MADVTNLTLDELEDLENPWVSRLYNMPNAALTAFEKICTASSEDAIVYTLAFRTVCSE